MVGNPLYRLGYVGHNQIQVFKKYLRVPFPYLTVIVKNYRDLSQVPPILPKLVDAIHRHHWSTMKDITNYEVHCKAKGIPVPYIRDDKPLLASAEIARCIEGLISNINTFSESSYRLYLYSGFQTSALRAASKIMKAALSSRVDAKMVSFGTLLERVKTWDTADQVVQSCRGVTLLCLYLVGSEYNTEFTCSVLKNLIMHRAAEGKPTILCSHLTPIEFSTRYGFPTGSVELKLEDDKQTTTIEALLTALQKS